MEQVKERDICATKTNEKSVYVLPQLVVIVASETKNNNAPGLDGTSTGS